MPLLLEKEEIQYIVIKLNIVWQVWDSTHRMKARKKAGRKFNTANCVPQIEQKKFVQSSSLKTKQTRVTKNTKNKWHQNQTRFKSSSHREDRVKSSTNI